MMLSNLRHPLYLVLTTFMALLSSVSAVFSQAYPKHSLTIQSDNDAYLMMRQDRYYTNGLLLTYSMPWVQKKDKTTLLSVQVGHQLYNGIRVQIGDTSYWDRPSTAYLFLNGELQRVFGEDWLWAIKTELSLVGRGAKGEEVQTYVHDLLRMYAVQSWESQVQTAIGLDLEARLSKKIWRNEVNSMELSGGGAARVGMSFSQLAAQLSFRWGKLADFRRSHFTQHGGFFNRDTEYYFFYTPKYTYQIYNATIQGSFFARNQEQLMPSLSVHHFGFAWSNPRFAFDAGVLFQTKESRKIYFNHQYGSIKFGYRF